MANLALTPRPHVDLIVGTARIPVQLIDLTEDGAAVELPGPLGDLAGSSLHVHGVGRLPVDQHRVMSGACYVLSFGDVSAKQRRKLLELLDDRGDDLVGPAIDYLVTTGH